jgi:hypothetical protein
LILRVREGSVWGEHFVKEGKEERREEKRGVRLMGGPVIVL